MLNGLDLFSRIGGMSIALKEWVRPVAYCEIDFYCQGVLLSRMANGELPKAPIWDDVRNLGYRTLCYAEIDIIYGGFSCQDISIAGTGKGVEGKRSGLFFEIIRLAKEIKPKFIFIENVAAITTRGGVRIVNEITSLGYDCRWITIKASSVGAIHKRERWFLLAHTNSQSSGQTNQVTESDTNKQEARLRSSRHVRGESAGTYWTENKCPLLGMDDGLPFELDRARALGNSVCVEQTREAFKELIGIDK